MKKLFCSMHIILVVTLAPLSARAQIEGPLPNGSISVTRGGTFNYPELMNWIASQAPLASQAGSVNADADIGRLAIAVQPMMAASENGRVQAFRNNDGGRYIYVTPSPVPQKVDPLRLPLRKGPEPKLNHAALGLEIRKALETDRKRGSYVATDEILSRLFDGNSQSPIAASENDLPEIWATVDAFLSTRLGVGATQTTARRLRVEARRQLLRPRVELVPALTQAFAEVHALGRSKSDIQRALEKNKFYLQDNSQNTLNNRMRQVFNETVGGIHPDRIHILDVQKPVEVLSAHDALWQWNPEEQRWQPIGRRLGWGLEDGGREVQPEGWPPEALDNKRFIAATGNPDNSQRDKAFAAPLQIFSLKPGIWGINAPLPKHWRKKVLIDLILRSDE